MPTCPKGHDSVAADYCDECGTAIGAPPVAAPAPGPAGTLAMPAAPGAPCPDCATPRVGRFCEVCGHDFLAEPAPASGDTTVPTPADGGGSPAPTTATPDTAGSAPTGAGQANGGGTPGLPRRGAPTGWRLVASADRAFHARMRAEAMPDAPVIDFPAYCPERRFGLDGGQVLIGRRSRARGIEPEIDLTGPPEDTAVSHAHALLVATPDGWTVVDLDSANGTYLNESPDPLPPNQQVALGNGDRIHVGAWTTLTIQAG